MKNRTIIIFLILLVAVAFYFLGRKNGSNQTKTDIVQNVALVTEIAELSALDVTGSTNLKMTNRGDNESMWNKFKNYFAESTLQLTIPFDAKYGVDMKDQKVSIDTKSGIATVYLPPCKMLSLQLRLDRVDAIAKTGILTSLTIDEYVKAQKQLYEEASKNLSTNAGYMKLAQEHIKFILEKYYSPLGLKVECVFGGKKTLL